MPGTSIRYMTRAVSNAEFFLLVHPFRSASVDRGPSVLDPGMVPNGAKCEDNGMCVNQVCTPVKTLPTPCSGTANCSGPAHGVCNSRNHCHCTAGYGSFDCSKPGYGGSVDSNPASNLAIVVTTTEKTAPPAGVSQTAEPSTDVLTPVETSHFPEGPTTVAGTLIFISPTQKDWSNTPDGAPSDGESPSSETAAPRLVFWVMSCVLLVLCLGCVLMYVYREQVRERFGLGRDGAANDYRPLDNKDDRETIESENMEPESADFETSSV